jgi:DNA replication and repair protein RecF
VQLTRIRVFHYRNLADQELRFPAGASLLFGLNGQGKTNLLEAIYVLAYGKSFRTSKPKDCIRHDEQECLVEGTVSDGSTERILKVKIGSQEKVLSIHGKAVGVDEFVGNFDVLAFAHEHLKVVRESPGDRRAFLDRGIIPLLPSHIRCLAAYGRALKQRNRVLADARNRGIRLDDAHLESWDEALVRNGAPIISNRLRYVREIKLALPQNLFGTDELKLHYLSEVASHDPDVQQIEREFRLKLLQARSADQRHGSTSVGPHRDDLKMFLEGKPLSHFGSSGQQRSALLSLYFAQMEIHRDRKGFYPVFLVDDVEAELDMQRLEIFLRYLSQRTQIFLTSAKDFLLPYLPADASRFRVEEGSVRPLAGPPDMA